MKKIICILVLALCVLLTSCGTEMVQEQSIIVDKYTGVESEYHHFLKGWETYTVYYFVLENGQVKEVYSDEYGEYRIGDTYTYTVVKKVVNDNGN